MIKLVSLKRVLLALFGRDALKGFRGAGVLGGVLVIILVSGLAASFDLTPPEESGRRLASRTSHSDTPTLSVVVRNEQGGSETQEVSIPELSGHDSFENDDFKIVLKKDVKAISLDEPDEILRLKAATVFFHATRARHYFKEVLKAKEVDTLGKVVIRIDHTSAYDELGHYKHENNSEPEYNNATSIPAGKHFKKKPGEETEWGPEMWFRPRKEIPIREILAEMKKDPMEGQIANVRDVLYPFVADSAIRNMTFWINNTQHTGSQLFGSFRSSIGTILFAEVGFQLVKGLNRLFIPNHYYIDSALVPEIIYHEFTHIALGTTIGIKVSTPINEGLADYFAARIANSPKLGARIRDYSTARVKNAKSKKLYNAEFELLGNDSSDFVLSLLWNLDDVVGDERELRLVYESRRFMNPYRDDVVNGLTLALQLACKTECEAPSRDSDKLYKYFIKRGLMKDRKP